jgi:hypothetical protein
MLLCRFGGGASLQCVKQFLSKQSDDVYVGKGPTWSEHELLSTATELVCLGCMHTLLLLLHVHENEAAWTALAP